MRVRVKRLNDENNTPKSSSSPNKHIFVRAKGCAYYEKSAYYECAYYERASI